MIRKYQVTFKREYGDPTTLDVAAKNIDNAIERGRVALWKKNKWHKKSDWDVILVSRGDEIVV